MSRAVIEKAAIAAYVKQFGHQPACVAIAPGRINLLGEHLDYNGGLVMPAAIDKYIAVAIGTRTDEAVHALACDMDETCSFGLHRMAKDGPTWSSYLKGPLQQCIKLGFVPTGLNVAIVGNIPHGAGLSSSAAFENAVLAALDALYGWNIAALQRVQMAQAAEHEFAGVNCGIMDMYASMFGKKDELLCLDCSTLTATYHPFAIAPYQLVLCNSGVKHALAESAYNERRFQCEAGLQLLQQLVPAVKSFSDVSMHMLLAFNHKFDEKVFNRLLYVIQEMERVAELKEDLAQQNFAAIGQKMYATHHGLSHLYEVSCTELDAMVAEAKQHTCVLGSRLMGGGFGGCTLSLVATNGMAEWLAATANVLYSINGTAMQHYVVCPADGVSVSVV
jgi:galactokinase